jgi:GNAT superfamily N-acetyltransferase
MTPHAEARELEWLTSEYMLRWLRLMPDVSLTTFGEARGACCPGQADVDFLNTVHRLLPDEADLVRPIADTWRAAGVGPWLELMPAPGFERLAGELSAVGGRQVGFLVVLERELPAPAPAATPPGVEVERVGDAVDEFARVIATGHEVPEARLEGAIARCRLHARVDGARLYLAAVDGTPAAAAVLFVMGDVAYLANASTLPSLRRRGCQGALIQRRLTDAAEAGCRQACVLTEWGSQSHDNVARAGFRAAYTKAVWRLAPPA